MCSVKKMKVFFPAKKIISAGRTYRVNQTMTSVQRTCIRRTSWALIKHSAKSNGYPVPGQHRSHPTVQTEFHSRHVLGGNGWQGTSKARVRRLCRQSCHCINGDLECHDRSLALAPAIYHSLTEKNNYAIHGPAPPPSIVFIDAPWCFLSIEFFRLCKYT